MAGNTAPQCAQGGGACQVATSVATCPSGYFVTGGGYATTQADDHVGFAASGPGDTSFTVIAVNRTVGQSATVTAQAFCAAGPGLTGSKDKGFDPARIATELKRTVSAR